MKSIYEPLPEALLPHQVSLGSLGVGSQQVTLATPLLDRLVHGLRPTLQSEMIPERERAFFLHVEMRRKESWLQTKMWNQYGKAMALSSGPSSNNKPASLNSQHCSSGHPWGLGPVRSISCPLHFCVPVAFTPELGMRWETMDIWSIPMK